MKKEKDYKKLSIMLIYIIAILLGFMVFMALGFSVRYDELARKATEQATLLTTCVLFN